MSRATIGALGALLLAAAAAAAPAAAQRGPLERRVADAPAGRVRFAYEPRPGACGDGEGFIRIGEHARYVSGHTTVTGTGRSFDRRTCEPGPAVATLDVQGGRVRTLGVTVGPAPRVGDRDLLTDLGEVSPDEAARYLLALARSAAGQRVHGEAIFAATLADAEVWPDLLALARDGSAPSDARKSGVFWLGQAAGDRVTAQLDRLVEEDTLDRDVREQAVFALSQRPRAEGIPPLLRIARTHRDPEIRKKALFWLGQSNDPRAIALFEEILTRRN